MAVARERLPAHRVRALRQARRETGDDRVAAALRVDVPRQLAPVACRDADPVREDLHGLVEVDLDPGRRLRRAARATRARVAGSTRGRSAAAGAASATSSPTTSSPPHRCGRLPAREVAEDRRECRGRRRGTTAIDDEDQPRSRGRRRSSAAGTTSTSGNDRADDRDPARSGGAGTPRASRASRSARGRGSPRRRRRARAGRVRFQNGLFELAARRGRAPRRPRASSPRPRSRARPCGWSSW